MDRKEQEKLYRQQMGDEAAERQKTDACWGCGAKKGQPHSQMCRYRNAARAGSKPRFRRP